MIEVATFVVSGALLEFFIELTGVGGGVLTVPVLILIMRLDPIAAVGTASVRSVLTKTYGTMPATAPKANLWAAVWLRLAARLSLAMASSASA